MRACVSESQSGIKTAGRRRRKMVSFAPSLACSPAEDLQTFRARLTARILTKGGKVSLCVQKNRDLKLFKTELLADKHLLRSFLVDT